MDSDTVLAPDAIRQAAAAFGDDQVGAVSGSVGVLNAPTNLLTRLIHHRYRLRFQVERPAQGFFTSLLCCSGPFAVYRRALLAELWQRYLTQTFGGVRCTNGDDLHLTNLVLATGHQVLFEPRAIASTSVPRSLGQYLRQQLRWNRSFYRELRWTFDGIRSRHPYLVLDVLARALLPLLLAAALLLLASEGLLVGWELLAADLSLALAMLLRDGRVPAGARGQRPVPAAVRAAARGPAGPGPGLCPGHAGQPQVGDPLGPVSCGSGTAAAWRCAPRPRCPSPGTGRWPAPARARTHGRGR